MEPPAISSAGAWCPRVPGPTPKGAAHKMTFEELCTFEVLYDAYLTARRGKRKKSSTAQYEAQALACTDRLVHLLISGQYRPGKFETFEVFEPKRRLVQAPAFVDKVVQHALVDNILYEAIPGASSNTTMPPRSGRECTSD